MEDEKIKFIKKHVPTKVTRISVCSGLDSNYFSGFNIACYSSVKD